MFVRKWEFVGLKFEIEVENGVRPFGRSGWGRLGWGPLEGGGAGSVEGLVELCLISHT